MSELEPGQVLATPTTAQLITDARATATQSVRTTVKKNEQGAIEVTCSHRLPEFDAIKTNMTHEYSKKIKKHSYWSLNTHILNTQAEIPFQIWADAISAAVMMSLANDQGATSELQNITQSCYMALGTTLFKLSPVAMVPQTKALATARKKIRDVIELEGKQLRESSEAAVTAILDNAARVRAEALRLREEVKREMASIPPQWLIDTGYPIHYHRSNQIWEVQIVINFQITQFDLKFSGTGYTDKKYTWNAEHMDPHLIRLWVPVKIDGDFQATAIHVDSHDPELPHITHSSGCMGLAAGPKKITRLCHLEELQYALEDCHRRVQLDSLFTDIGALLNSFKSAFPKELADALKKNRVSGAIALAHQAVDAQTINYEEETRTTWTA